MDAPMDTLHIVLRAIRGETRTRADHLSVFREFLGHLDRIGKRAPGHGKSNGRAVKHVKPNGKPPAKR